MLTGGLAILGTAALLAALAAGRSGRSGRRGHGKRSIEEQRNLDLELAVLSQIEPEQCFRRLVCDLATGQMPPSQNDLIASLFEEALRSSGFKSWLGDGDADHLRCVHHVGRTP